MRALIVLAIACATTVAAAQSAPKPGTKAAVAEAKKHYKQGEAFLKLADENPNRADRQKIYDDAIAEFEEAYRLSPLPEVIYYIAQVYREKGDEERALERYQKFVDQKPDGATSDSAREWIAQLKLNKQRRDDEARRKAEDEAKRKADEEARRQAEAVAAAERARQDELHRKEDEARRQREAADKQRRDDEAARQAEIARKQAVEQAARDDWNAKRADRAKRRGKGWKYAGVGAGFVAVAGVFAYLGSQQYSQVGVGGFAHASDIDGAIKNGKIYNGISLAFVVPGALFLAIGVPRVVANWDKGEYKVAAVASRELTGLVLSGPLP